MSNIKRVIIAAISIVSFIGIGLVLLDYSIEDDPVETVQEPITLGYKIVGLNQFKPKVAHIELPSITVFNWRLAEKKVQPGLHGLMRFGPIKVDQSIVANVVKAAHSAKINPALLMAIAEKESNFVTKAKAKTSSATGLFQFIDRTWFKVMKKFGPRYGYTQEARAITDDSVNGRKRVQILSLRNDSFLSAALAAEMLKRESGELADKIGRPLSAGETYLIHFLGIEDAEKFMTTLVASPNAPAAALLPQPAQANKPIFYAKQGQPLTIAQVHSVFESMMGKRFKRYQNVATKLPKGAIAYTE